MLQRKEVHIVYATPCWWSGIGGTIPGDVVPSGAEAAARVVLFRLVSLNMANNVMI